MNQVNRGDLFWIVADETRGSFPGVPHPHVVVQEDVFNHSRISTVVVCALSSNPNKAREPGNVLLEPGEGGLARQSVVIATQVSCVPKARLGAYIGSLSSDRVDQVVEGLRFVQRSFQRDGAQVSVAPEPTTVLLGDVLWRGRDPVTFEHGQIEHSMEQCRVSELIDSFSMQGCVLSTLEGRPYRVDYLVRCDRAWNTRSVSVRTTHGLVHQSLELERDAAGAWRRDGERLAGLDGVVDVDLGITPATNTLPIRRLSLEPGDEAEVDALWVGFPSLELERLSQRYRRESDGAYRYESGGGDFSVALDVDARGIVVRYGDLWERVLP